MEFTREQAIAEHRKMWNWIAKETERRRHAVSEDDYFDCKGVPDDERPSCDCFCCGYCKDNCFDCPIQWPTHVTYEKCCDNFEDDGQGLYSLWRDACDMGSAKTAAMIARQIANLPERTDNTPEETQ